METAVYLRTCRNKTAFKPTNTISHLIKERNHIEKQPEKCGIYKLTGHTFGKAYIGHTE